jgi:hypothetical protein
MATETPTLPAAIARLRAAIDADDAALGCVAAETLGRALNGNNPAAAAVDAGALPVLLAAAAAFGRSGEASSALLHAVTLFCNQRGFHEAGAEDAAFVRSYIPLAVRALDEHGARVLADVAWLVATKLAPFKAAWVAAGAIPALQRLMGAQADGGARVQQCIDKLAT